MITVNDISMNFSGQTLFKHVDLKFVPGNCYGIIIKKGKKVYHKAVLEQ